MKKRSIKKIIPAQRVNMGGHLLDQPLPVQGVEMIDPFLLIHHWNEPLAKGGRQSELGVGPHPHRGFSPVTFIFKGSVRHQDSIGNTAVISSGGTQWMHAGNGIVHSERPGIELVKNGGEQEFIQFWVNTPAKYKMEAPTTCPLLPRIPQRSRPKNQLLALLLESLKHLKGQQKRTAPRPCSAVKHKQEQS